MPFKPRDELGDIQTVYPEFLEASQCGKLVQGMTVELVREISAHGGVVRFVADVELLHKGKQPELVQMNKWSGPHLFLWYGPGVGISFDGDGEGVVKVSNGGDIPGVTC